jgi:hypothetical protein
MRVYCTRYAAKGFGIACRLTYERPPVALRRHLPLWLLKAIEYSTNRLNGTRMTRIKRISADKK